MDVVVRCKCGLRKSVNRSLAGKRVKCKRCGNIVEVSAPSRAWANLAPSMMITTVIVGLAMVYRCWLAWGLWNYESKARTIWLALQAVGAVATAAMIFQFAPLTIPSGGLLALGLLQLAWPVGGWLLTQEVSYRTFSVAVILLFVSEGAAFAGIWIWQFL